MSTSDDLYANSDDELDFTPLKFGKYRGKTAEWISENDPNYLKWAYENVAQFNVCSEVLYREAGGKRKRAISDDAKNVKAKQQELDAEVRNSGKTFFEDGDDDIPF